ncbi:EF-hand domain-containing protein [Burkholderia sp. Ac-20384]|uniref:EF-hand domain-containing protein n=1 Tax=Burkholderia sp. Ac-20384 TaxID=2703902 RepID=UPI00198049E0|nr:EF-hand domain-containing protein [Burkholderia sp. Ac-20384]MBN3829154.1 EF-hand domain-containing protein [Burkholderia sp. Ac-20384]
MKSIKKMIAVVVLCIVSAAASAQQVPPGAANGGARVERALMQLQTRFANANTTHDGKLTREQAAAGMPMVAQHFDEIDTQHNGYVTLEQLAGFMRQRMAAR